MIRFAEALKAAVGDATGDVVLEFVNADLVEMVGEQGAYQPMVGVLSKSVGTIGAITKMICRRKSNPDGSQVLIFKNANGISMATFNAFFAENVSLIPDLPKFPVLGGYEIVLSCTTAGGAGDVSFMTKGENAPPNVLGISQNSVLRGAYEDQVQLPPGRSHGQFPYGRSFNLPEYPIKQGTGGMPIQRAGFSG